MIEIIDAGHDIGGRNLDGKIVLGGLPLKAYGAWFPAVAVFVRKSSSVGFVCDRAVLKLGAGGEVVSVHPCDHSGNDQVKIRPEYVRFVCDTVNEAVALINTQGEINAAIKKKSGYAPDSEIARDIAGIFDNVISMDNDAPSFGR